MKRPSGYAAALRNRDYRLLLSALTISEVGSWAYNVGLAVFVFTSTRSPGWVAAASLTRFLSALVVSPYAGVLADRFERVRLMSIIDLAACASMALLAVVAALHAPVALAIALAALTSIAGSLYSPAVKATTPSIVGEEQLAAANSLESTVDNLAVIVGPAVGAALLLLGPPHIAFAVNAASFAYSAFVVSRIKVRSAPADVTEGGAAGPLKQIAAGVNAVFSSPAVTMLVGFSVLASFVYGTDTVLFVVIGDKLLGTGSSGYGYLLAGLGAGGILAAAGMNRIAASPRLGTFIALGMLLYCLPTALITVVHAPAAVVSFQLVRGAGTVVVDVLAMTALQRLVARDLVARVFGVFFAFVLAATSLGTIIAPVLLATLGLTGALLVMGCAIPVAVLVAYPRIRSGIDKTGLEQLARIEPRIALLHRLDIFAAATRPVLERLAVAAVDEQVAARTVLIREGDIADDFFVLVSGEVQVTAHGAGQESRALGALKAPAYFGELGLLEHLQRTATVTATTECALYRLSGDEFLDAMTSVPLSPSALGLAQLRLSRTHPSHALRFAGVEGSSGGGGLDSPEPAQAQR